MSSSLDLLDLHRHGTVAVLMAQHMIRWSAPFALAIFPLMGLVAIWMAIRIGGVVRLMAIVLGLMLASYYLVYVTTPFDISWHVSTSVDRLLVQLWPALVLTVFLGLQSSVPSPQSSVPGLQSRSPSGTVDQGLWTEDWG